MLEMSRRGGRIAWVALVCAVFAAAPTIGWASVPHTDNQAVAPQPDVADLEIAFEQAGADFGVPAALLKAIAWQESRWTQVGPTVDMGWGIMHLVDNGEADTLLQAAELIGASPEDLQVDALANIRGAAALLASYADQPETIEGWFEAAKLFTGLQKDVQATQALEYFRVLNEGVDGENGLGMAVQFDAVAVDIDMLSGQAGKAVEKSSDYGPAIWNAAASCNYTSGRGGNSIRYWVNHWVGTGTYAGAISWFKNCNAGSSAHFVIRKSDGQLTQMVALANTAWHAGNYTYNQRSIGIEHEATPSNPWPTSSSSPMLVNSATCCRTMCDRYGIPKTRSYILGHNQISSTACPGPLPWDTYMALVAGTPPIPSWDASYHAQSFPSSMVAGSTAIVWAEYVNKGSQTWAHSQTYLGTSSPQDRSSPFCNTPNWPSCTRTTDVDQSAVATNAVGRFTFILKAPSTPGTYTEKYRLVREGVTWFGPEVSWTITVTAANGNLTGTVTNANGGAAIAGASVSLAGIGSTTTNSSGVYTFSNVAAGTYTASVSATGFNGASASVGITAGATATKNFALTPSDTQAPSVPTNLATTVNSATSVKLTWTASTDNIGVTGYEIRRDGATIGSSTTTSYTDNGAAPDTTQEYQVRAKDAVPNYSAWCAAVPATTPPAAPQLTTVLAEGFTNLNGWTQGGSAFALSSEANHGTHTGGAAAYCAPGEADQMHYIFARPFAQGKVSGYFWDGKGGWKAGVCGYQYRQALSLRDTAGAAKMYLDNCLASNVGAPSYYYRVLSESGNTNYVAMGTRNPNTDCQGAWIYFETNVAVGAPTASPPGTATFKVTDGAGSPTVPVSLPPEFSSHGIGRITLGLGVTSVNDCYWDDITFVAMPPGRPTLSGTAGASSIQWNFTPADNNFFGWEVANDDGTLISATYPNANWLSRTATSWTETGLAANTTYARKARAWNGTLNGAYSLDAEVCTLSVPPAAGSIVADNATPLPGQDVVWTAVGGFGAGKVQSYKYAWDTNPTYTFTGSEPSWSSGNLVLSPTSGGTWYLHVQGFNAAGAANGTFDYSVTAGTLPEPVITEAMSRKLHDGVSFDVNLLESGAIEGRAGGPTRIFVVFDVPVQVLAEVNPAVVVSSGTVSEVIVDDNQVTIELEGVTDRQAFTMALPGVASIDGVACTGSLCCGVLMGDAAQQGSAAPDGLVNIYDLIAVKGALDKPIDATNFRCDIASVGNGAPDGLISIYDLIAVKGGLDKTLTSTCP